MPDAIYDEGDRLTTDRNSKGDRLPATYANFLILNGAVIYPTYNQPEKDEEAKRQIQLAFPDRDVRGLSNKALEKNTDINETRIITTSHYGGHRR